MQDNELEEIERKAKINGKIVDYDFTHNTKDDNPYPNARYIGKGVIWSLRGIKQGFTKIMHFWRRR